VHPRARFCANLAGKVVERDGVTPVVVGDD
jgi:hypothetical protein